MAKGPVITQAVRVLISETYDAHKGVYEKLSSLIHPNREAIDLETWHGKEIDNKKSIGRKSILGGYIDIKYFPLQFHTLIMMASNAARVLALVGLYGATDTWKQQCDQLHEVVFTIAAKYSSPAKQPI